MNFCLETGREMRFIIVALSAMLITCALADKEQYLSYDDFVRQVESGNIRSVTLDRFSSITGTMVDGDETYSIRSYAGTGSANDPLLTRFLKEHGVSVSMRDVSKPRHTMPMVTGFMFLGAPIVFLILLAVIIMKLNRVLSNQRRHHTPTGGGT